MSAAAASLPSPGSAASLPSPGSVQGLKVIDFGLGLTAALIAKQFAELGASAFIISSDQGQMRRAVAQTLSDFNKLVQAKASAQETSHVSQH